MNLFQILARHPTVDLLKLSAGNLEGVIQMDTFCYFRWKADRVEFMFMFYQYCFEHFDALHSKEKLSSSFSHFVASKRKEYD